MKRFLLKTTSTFEYNYLVTYIATFRSVPKIGEIKTEEQLRRYYGGPDGICASDLWTTGVQLHLPRQFNGASTIVVLADVRDDQFHTLATLDTA
ncbi:hypothetical protein A3Q40_03108 [Rhodococcus sp. PBTS 1]|nr:hypothetical protein A3Q40_03108 [Rhodococcus sp. PBTS 1]